MSEEEQLSKYRDWGLRLGAPLGFGVFLLGLWLMAVDQEWLSGFILPHPSDVWTSFWDQVQDGDTWVDFWATTYVTIVGFLLGAAFGIVLAVATALSRVLNAMLYPFVIALQVMPRVAIAPILIAWLGFGYSPKIAFIVLIVFFPVFVNTLAGMQSVNAESREMFRSLGATRWQTFTKLLFPTSLPVMFAGFKTGMTFALLGVIVAEFISADKGLGVLVSKYSFQLSIDAAFAIIALLTLLGLVLYGVMQWIDRVVVFWMHDGRMSAKTRRLNRRDRTVAGGGPSEAGAALDAPGDAAAASSSRP